MKFFSGLMLVLASFVINASAFADEHETCTKDGKPVEAKDKADCESRGGTWGTGH